MNFGFAANDPAARALRLRTAAFTGHRDYRDNAPEALRRALLALYAEGVRTFLSGMAVGFDLAAAEAVCALRPCCPDIRLVAVVPFAEQSARFGAAARSGYERLLAAADEIILLSETYATGCYHRRNDFLIAHASRLVAWYDGRKGGTQYTFQKALRSGLQVVNLAPRMACQPELFGSWIAPPVQGVAPRL